MSGANLAYSTTVAAGPFRAPVPPRLVALLARHNLRLAFSQRPHVARPVMLLIDGGTGEPAGALPPAVGRGLAELAAERGRDRLAAGPATP